MTGWNKPIRIKTAKDNDFNKGLKLAFAFVSAFFIFLILPTIVRTISEAFEAGL